MIDGEPWFVAKDVTDMLGFANGRSALAQHLRVGQMGSVAIHDGTPGSPTKAIISEAGLYRLIMRSNVAGAERFQDWVTGEVLPTIRKTGGAYIAPGSQAEPPAPLRFSAPRWTPDRKNLPAGIASS